MAESDRTRERERPPIAENPYEIVMRTKAARTERNRTGPVVIKPSDHETYLARQGRLMFYLNPHVYKDTPLQQWQVFKHEIRTHSGKHRHQGGLIIYVLDGKGYSIIDEVRVDWKRGDLLLLPIKPEGVVHQHFNTQPGTPAHWVAFYSIPMLAYLADTMVQLEVSPEYKG